MKQIWKSILASLCLVGIAGAAVAAALHSSRSTVETCADGRQMMVDAQYRLAIGLRR